MSPMAGGWVKALHCKNNATEDVYHHHHHHHHHQPTTPKKLPFSSSSSSSSPNKRNDNFLYSNLGCGRTSHHLKDIIHMSNPKSKSSRHKSSNSKSQPLPSLPLQPVAVSQNQRKQPKANAPPSHLHHRSLSSLPTLVPLSPNHSSRKVVEIIFTSSWSMGTNGFPGEIEMVFKVQNQSKTVARFEEYREKVRSSAGPADSRCAVDGNEMMKFHPVPASPAEDASGLPICGIDVIWPIFGDGGMRTFSGSCGAYDRIAFAAAGGRKRKAMVVCRVIAGRVWTGSKSNLNRVECESVSVREGELLVFDPRAVLPCFLLIYKI